MEHSYITEIDTQTYYEKVMNLKEPYILDFYSDECAPCESLAPKYEEMAYLFGEKVQFYKIFRQKNRDLATSLGVSSSPTVIFYKDGKEVGTRLRGGIKKKELLEQIQNLVPSDYFKERLKAKKPRTEEYDVLILGGGPAGFSAAIYASQAKLKTVIVDPELTGGQVKITHLISNYPGTGKAVNGYELMELMLHQAKDSGTHIIAAVDITQLEISENGGLHKIVLDNGDLTLYAKSVIIATGAKPRTTGAKGETELRGMGISYCATCDGKYYEGKEIVVVGGGNSAVEESLFLTRFATKIQIIQNLEYLTANKTAVDKLLRNEKISVNYNTVVTEFSKLSNQRMLLKLKNLKDNSESQLETDGVFVFVGMQPNTELLPNSLQKDKWGYLITNEDMETNIPGVYAVGDVRSKKIRQAATAVGDGAIAGILVEKYVEEFDARVKTSY
ncbi:MAG: FAD-dependent oxidoreductase [Leptospiraceae bacterium]|nr:FAD-dependent oxidoreductase [Leptospiraceae bacterium]